MSCGETADQITRHGITRVIGLRSHGIRREDSSLRCDDNSVAIAVHPLGTVLWNRPVMLPAYWASRL